MNKYIFGVLLALLSLPVFAQKQTQAKLVLDKTAAALEQAGGVKAGFTVRAFNKGRSVGEANGVIELKGEKFFLKTGETISWFDGKTQWTYLTGSGEVNVSTPTESELQGLNPYALLYLYKKGFDYELGKADRFRDNAVYEVILRSANRKQEISRIVLYVRKNTYEPVHIRIDLHDGSRNDITIDSYQAGLKLPDSVFVFDKKEYPTAEIIDLR